MGALTSGTTKVRLLAGTGLLLLSCLPAESLARPSDDAEIETEQSEDGEIIVTAQRRPQSTMDVGINVTQLSAERIAEERIVTMYDLQQVTSNVHVRNSGGGLQTITIRGVGMNDFTPASNPSTSVYFDGVYSPNMGTIGQQFFDLQEIEVLKGPQSTLYGRNATSGAVIVASAEPTEEFSGYMTAGYGNYQAVDAEAAISGPLAEGLTARLSFRTRQQYDGWYPNLFPGGQDSGDVHQTSLRAQLKWQASDSLSIRGIFGYQHRDDRPQINIGFGRRLPGGTPTTTTGFCPVSVANQVDYGNSCASLFGARRTSTELRSFSENDPSFVRGNAYTGTAIVKYDGGGFAITSTTGYLDWHQFSQETDSLSVTEFTTGKDQNTWQFSQDLQIASAGARALDWMAGIYLSTANVDLPSYGFSPSQGRDTLSTHDADIRTAQAYLQFDYTVSPRLTLSAGARYIHEFSSKVGGSWTDVNKNAVLDAGDTQRAYADASMKQDALTWKFGINYKPTPRTLIYASVTHGFKSGGYTAPASATTSSQLLPYKGEHIYAFEAGFKHAMLDGALNLSASAFYYKYDNMQTNTQTLVGNANINLFANIPKSHLKGADLAFVARPVEGLEIRFDAGYLDTYAGEFTSNSVTYAPGNRFANAPKFSGSSSFRYETALTGDIDVALGGSAHRHGSSFANTENNPALFINTDATIFDAQLQFLMPERGLTVSFWGKNLSDTTYSNGGFQNSSVTYNSFNPPRTYGVSLAKRF